MRARLNQLWPLLVLLGCAGCNSRGGPQHVFGSVSYDARPIESGTIELIPIRGTTGPAMGASIIHGKFDVPAAKGPRPGGIYKVVITATRNSGETVPNIFEPGGKPLPIGEPFVPARYNSESTLTVTISDEEAKNELRFELEAPQ